MNEVKSLRVPLFTLLTSLFFDKVRRWADDLEMRAIEQSQVASVPSPHVKESA